VGFLSIATALSTASARPPSPCGVNVWVLTRRLSGVGRQRLFPPLSSTR
jgi:hypothetical protein